MYPEYALPHNHSGAFTFLVNIQWCLINGVAYICLLAVYEIG